MTSRFLTSFLAGCCCLCVGAGPAAHAETPPLPPRKATSLTAIQKQIEDSQQEQEELQKKAETIERDMKGLKTDLIDLAGQVQTQEKDLYALEQRLSQLKSDKEKLTQKLKDQKKSIADLILAMERIRRLPPEALVARPDAPLETAQAATVLTSILPELDRRSKKLRLDLEDLDAIEKELTEKQAELKDSTEKLKTDRASLDKMMQQRESTLEATKSEVEDRRASIARLSQSARDLNDLIAKVEEQNREMERRAAEENRKPEKNSSRASRADRPAAKETSSPKVAAQVRSLGNARLPVSGSVVTRFGETDDIGAKSEGITISARPGAVVVAPVSGIVRYAGPFKKYGTIILLEHKNKFHSLVAGLGKIDTVEGQSVDAGEPLGRLPDYTGRLYYELRYHGDPVNPDQQFDRIAGRN